MLQAQRLDPGSVDWPELDRFSDRMISQTRPWLDFIAQAQRAEPVVAALYDERGIAGCFTGLIVTKFGLRILGSPFPGWTTSYMGFNLLPGVDRLEALETIKRFAFHDLRCAHLEMMDRKITSSDLAGRGYDWGEAVSFEIDLTKSEEELFSAMTSACRRCIRKAGKNGVVIEDAHDPGFADDYYAQLQDVFAKQRLVPTYDVERVRVFVKWLLPTGRLLMLRARDPEGRCIATGLFPAFNTTAFFWGGASLRKHQILRPNEAIMWHAMRYWKERGIRTFDMGGGGEYKRKYGPTEISVPWLRVSKYPGLSLARYLSQRMFVNIQRARGAMGGLRCQKAHA